MALFFGWLQLTEVYTKSEGENAFAVMNVMTDLISHQDIYSYIPLFSLRANQYYRRISDWMTEYCIEAEKRSFKIENYIEEYSHLVSTPFFRQCKLEFFVDLIN